MSLCVGEDVEYKGTREVRMVVVLVFYFLCFFCRWKI